MFGNTYGSRSHADTEKYTSIVQPLMEERSISKIVDALEGQSLANIHEMRACVDAVGPVLTEASLLHPVATEFAKRCLERTGGTMKGILETETLARSFLAYEFVHHNVDAVTHVQDGGALKKVLPTAVGKIQDAVVAKFSSMFNMSSVVEEPEEPKGKRMPEVAYFLFKYKGGMPSVEASLDAQTLRDDRVNDASSEQVEFLNEIDAFIMKYFVAHLDEMRKEQVEKEVHDANGEFLGYRAGFKVDVALDVRRAILSGNTNQLKSVFSESLTKNHLTEDLFFETTSITGSGPRSFIKPKFEAALTGKAPQKTSWW